MAGSEPLGQLISALVDQRLDQAASRNAALWRHWSRLVGPEMAQHSEPVGIREGVLTIRVEAPVWVTQLSFLKPELLATLNSRLAGAPLSDIRFRAGALSRRLPDDRSVPPPPLPAATEAECRRAAELTAMVQDDQLRERLYRVILTGTVANRLLGEKGD